MLPLLILLHFLIAELTTVFIQLNTSRQMNLAGVQLVNLVSVVRLVAVVVGVAGAR